MSSVPEAVDALRSALHTKGVESHVQDAFNHLASCLVLLNSSSPSVQMIQKLCTALCQPLLPLYNACLQPALQLSSCVLSMVLGKLFDAQSIEDERLRSAWDETAKVILSGILDFLDQKDGGDIESDGAVWEALYRIICEFFFLDPARGLPVLSIQLCLSAYNTLTETAAKQITVLNALRHKAILGGERLGVAISRTKDYLLLEALLMLFARLLPPIHNTSQGKFKRIKFVKEVLGSPKLFRCSAEMLDIMQKTSCTHWDDVAAQIIDSLARHDITCPQPFSVDEIDVCGHVFPQPLATDRLIMDKQAFLANIIVEDNDPCESLQVPYSHIHKITLDTSEKSVPNGKVLIMVYLTSSPSVANTELKSSNGDLYAKFLLQNNDVGRFMEALRRRGVRKLSFLDPLVGMQRKRTSISIGSGLKFVNDSSPVPPMPMASFEGKVQHVNQVYKTDIAESEAATVHDGEIFPMPHPKSAFKDEVLAPEVLESAPVEDVPVPETLIAASLISPTKETSKNVSPGNSIGATRPFGDSDDELSEISEFEPEDDSINERVATGKSTSCNNELKLTRHKNDCILKNGSSNAISATGISDPASKTGGRTKRVVQRSPDTGKPLLTSPVSRSSSTRIDVSPKPLSNADALLIAVGNEFVGSLSIAPQDLVGADGLKKQGSEYRPSGTEVVSAGNPQTRFSPTEDELGQHARRMIPSSDVNQKVHSNHAITKDTSMLPKIAGNRRKREATNVDDDSTPPRKKRKGLDERLGIREDKVKPDDTSLHAISISRAKRCTTPTKGSSPITDPTMVDFNELPELKSSCVRRSSRIKKMQTVATVVTNVTRGKPQRSIQVDDPIVEIEHDTPLMLWSRPEPASSDALPPTEERSHSKTEDATDNKLLKADLRTVDNNVGRVQKIEPSISVKSTPQAETVTIDLTIDSSPAQEKSEQYGVSTVLVCSEAGTQTKPGTPDRSDCIAREPAVRSSPRRRRRSVTFASPIEYVLDRKVKSQPQVGPFSPRRRRSPSPLESNILSPLVIPAGPGNMRRESPDQVTPQVTMQKSKALQVSAHDQIADEIEIQDIVEVLNEIQAVIIKGISNRFKNVRKDVQRGRDELIQQVLDELHGIVVENAKYFNGLVQLEEDYYENGRSITRCWEELIDCNDTIATHFRSALADHDQTICPKTFPKSLLPMKPVSLGRRANT